MKVRVEQIGELYYPQYRRMCVWKNFIKDGKNVVFSKLEDAISYAKQYDVKIHEIN